MKKNSKRSAKSASPASGGAFAFKDRSGKVHGTAGRPRNDEGASPTPSSRPPRGRPKFKDREDSAPEGSEPRKSPWGSERGNDRGGEPASREKRGPRTEPGFEPPEGARGPKSFVREGGGSGGDRGPRPDRGGFPPRDGKRTTGKRDFGDRPAFGAQKPFGAKKSYGDKKSFEPRGDRPARGGFKDRGDRPSFGEKKPFEARGDRPGRGTFKDRGDRPASGEKKSFEPRGDRPDRGGFKPRGDRPERGGFGDRPDRGERSVFKPRGDRPGPRGPGGFGGGGDRRPARPGFRDREERRPGGGAFRERHGFTGIGGVGGESLRLRATVEKNAKGFAFLVYDKREFEDSYLSPDQAGRYFHGDRIEVVTGEAGEAIEVKLLAHRYTEVVGKYYRAGKREILLYERKKIREEIPVETKGLKPSNGDWVRAKLIFESSEEHGDRYHAEAIEVFGENIPASADVHMIATEFGVYEEHTAEAIREAESFSLDLSDPHRVDLTQTPFITIDGETARDFDDAVYVEKLPSAGYRLWVAIADVSSYVTKGTAIDDEALARATSVYFPERAFHMLPRALSENLCSLRPNEKRLTMVCRMDFSFEGRVTATRVMNAVIESRRRATYNEIQAEWEAGKNDPSFPFHPHFELYRILKKRRHARGSIDFDLPEAELKVEPNGEVISITSRPRLDAHRLIEEFMIAANEAVTEWALERHLPFIYRVHEEPAEKSLEKFIELCANSGVEIDLDFEDLTGSIQKFLKLVEGHPAQGLLNTALLRSMKQAHYTSVHGGHFGLASRAYTHFTSPIRRYPDLLVHRMLKIAVENERTKAELATDDRTKYENDLQDAAEHCSYRERVASEAERESIKLKQARFMLKEVGNSFTGRITGMMERGFFVTLDAPFVEGMVQADSLTDDFYEFREDRMLFQGKRRKGTFQMGQAITVTVARVDLETRQIDFAVPPDQAGDPTRPRREKQEPLPYVKPERPYGSKPDPSFAKKPGDRGGKRDGKPGGKFEKSGGGKFDKKRR